VQDGARVTLHGHVRDTGPKPSPDQLASLFVGEASAGSEPCARRSPIAHGVCRALLDAMGGRIWAESNPGAGMVVRFTFEAQACEIARAAGAPALQGRVLIVDDNATNRMVAQTLVEMFGCSCETAEDGQEAVDAAARGRFDAVLMDVRMPRMDGLTATRAIHALPGDAARLPVIALTANTGPEEVKACLAAGMQAVVEKPIKPDRLLGALAAAFAAPASEAASAAAA
jgi:CheY-like chemotaxis protein